MSGLEGVSATSFEVEMLQWGGLKANNAVDGYGVYSLFLRQALDGLSLCQTMQTIQGGRDAGTAQEQA